jgi:hypothetical protein
MAINRDITTPEAAVKEQAEARRQHARAPARPYAERVFGNA